MYVHNCLDRYSLCKIICLTALPGTHDKLPSKKQGIFYPNLYLQLLSEHFRLIRLFYTKNHEI